MGFFFLAVVDVAWLLLFYVRQHFFFCSPLLSGKDEKLKKKGKVKKKKKNELLELSLPFPTYHISLLLIDNDGGKKAQ